MVNASGQLFTNNCIDLRMAKGKGKNKGTVKDPQRANHSRISYLFQVATYLSTKTSCQMEQSSTEANDVKGTARHLVHELRSVSLKGQNRLSPALKQKFCKNCNSILVEGDSCSTMVENKSRRASKPWADVLLRTCNTCGIQRRYPLGPRQQRRPLRTIPREGDGKDDNLERDA